MLNNYKLDAEDEEILNELDNLCGVVQNKDVLKDIITYIKLRQNDELDFGNYNIIIRNDSSYNLLNDLIRVCAKIFVKYEIISNDRICCLDKIINSRRSCPFDKISGIEESIIVINDRKLHIEYTDEIDNLSRIMKQFKDKIFIFEDTNYCEGETDAELGPLVNWRLTIEKISLEDKLMYCRNRLDENNLKYKKQDIKEFVDVPFWMLKNMINKLIIECKSGSINLINKQMLNKNKQTFTKSNSNHRSRNRNKKADKSAKEELNGLIGLEGIKMQMDKILNYVKLNKERGKMPTLHMCFTGNPGTGKTSIARIIGKLFEQENILSGSGDFVEIHGRDLVAKYVGWTAQKVHNTVEKAIGGVLFIDEAYSLVSDTKGGFEDEAIATLIKEMEDHRDEICIILAGYTNEMENLIRQNPGFESRIQFTVEFPDYNENELLEIFTELCKKEHYRLSETGKDILINHFAIAKSKEAFGNGRYVRNIFEKVKFEQADRIIRTSSKSVNTINKTDIECALKSFTLDIKEKRKIGFCG
ncbi:MAG: AAA family ATPase [Clostridia bacterium]|nr:AAA family ATPase [Clostridia bacterium]